MSSNDRSERRVHIEFDSKKSIYNTSNLFFMGSCFGEEIHKKMIEIGHASSISNPFGTIFHPIPLLENLERIVLNKPCIAQEIFTQINAESASHHHLQFAYRFHNADKTALIDHIGHRSGTQTAKFIKSSFYHPWHRLALSTSSHQSNRW